MPACGEVVSMGPRNRARGRIEAELGVLDFSARLEEFGEPHAEDVGRVFGGSGHGGSDKGRDVMKLSSWFCVEGIGRWTTLKDEAKCGDMPRLRS